MGFGNKVSARTRLVNDDGSFNIQRVGEAAKPFEHLVNLPLSLFVLELLAVFLLLNALFATFYFGHGIEHLSGKPSAGGWEDFLHCYYFSVQTFTTVGYGYLNPQDHFTNIVSSFNSLIGLPVMPWVPTCSSSACRKPQLKSDLQIK